MAAQEERLARAHARQLVAETRLAEEVRTNAHHSHFRHVSTYTCLFVNSFEQEREEYERRDIKRLQRVRERDRLQEEELNKLKEKATALEESKIAEKFKADKPGEPKNESSLEIVHSSKDNDSTNMINNAEVAN